MTLKHSLSLITGSVLILFAAIHTTPRSLMAQSPAVNTSFEDLRFMEGRWSGTFRGDRAYEAYWSGPEGNAIMGMIRFIEDGETTLFELLTIEETDQGLVLRVKHFEPGLKGRQEKDDAVRYRLVEAGGNRAVFEHEENGALLSMEGDDPDVHMVRLGVIENGNRVWNDLFVGTRVE